jgi:hypothetical protein
MKKNEKMGETAIEDASGSSTNPFLDSRLINRSDEKEIKSDDKIGG